MKLDSSKDSSPSHLICMLWLVAKSMLLTGTAAWEIPADMFLFSFFLTYFHFYVGHLVARPFVYLHLPKVPQQFSLEIYSSECTKMLHKTWSTDNKNSCLKHVLITRILEALWEKRSEALLWSTEEEMKCSYFQQANAPAQGSTDCVWRMTDQ